jgi:hypothetical protein
MEDHMRKSVIPMAVAIVSMLGAPAYAAKYTCTFWQDGQQVGTCPIDSGNPNKFCEHIFSPTVTGSCGAQPAGLNLLICSLHDPKLKATEVAKISATSAKADIGRALAEQPGFVAAAVSYALDPDWPSNVIEVYRESGAGRLLQADCAKQ